MRWLYFHGLGSGPHSSKARALRAAFADEGVELLAPDLRLPSSAGLRTSAMLALGQTLVRPDTVLLGASLGGLLALHVAARVRPRALVLFAPALDLPDHRVSRPLLSTTWRWLGHFPVPDKAARGLTLVDAGFLADVEAFAACPEPTVPTLVFHGRQDRLVNVAVSRRFAEQHRDVRLVEVDDGHDLLVEMPTIVLEIRRFLQREACVGPAQPGSPGAGDRAR